MKNPKNRSNTTDARFYNMFNKFRNPISIFLTLLFSTFVIQVGDINIQVELESPVEQRELK
jgi:hypothetical protein